MYGEYHLLTKKPSPPKVVWGLSFPQVVAFLVGGKLSWEFAKLVPPLPLENPVLAHAHHLLPLAFVLALLYVREEKTGLPLYKYAYYWLRFRLRRGRTFVWKRGL